ncbi:MAG: phosphoribosyltransferase [Devosia sp.]|nr:phosphoribosyltransferase [Devosia sp.]
MVFRDRVDAGRQLAEALLPLAAEHPVVLALPRGGVPVAFEVARRLAAPLDLLIVRKLGVPGHAEFAMGAVADAEPPVVVRHDDTIRALGISAPAFEAVLAAEIAEARRRRDRYLGGRPRQPLAARTLIVVDDGIATGSTMQAALRALRQARPRRMVLAVPVAATPAIDLLRPDADEIVCVLPRPDLGSIGEWYDAFPQVEDAEVIRLLEAAAAPPPA